MRIKVLSDLHLDWWRLLYDRKGITGSPDGIDVLVIAGDLHSAGEAKESIKWFADNYEKIVIVPGNHDYYHGSFEAVDKEFLELENEYDNVHALLRKAVEINGHRFIGCTMWFPPSVKCDINMWRLTDSRLIKNFSIQVPKENKKDVMFLKNNIREGDVVVTHHAPSYMSVEPKYAGESTNCFYVCPMEETILDKKPKLWIHGHMHGSFSYYIGETQIVTNPLGYIDAIENPKFDKNHYIEI